MPITALVVATLGTWVTVRWANSLVRPTHPLGIIEGRLADCPDKPNCVSTSSPPAECRMPPIPLVGTADEARDTLEAIIGSLPSSRVMLSSNNYLHAECCSRLFGFVDDAEFLIDKDAGVIHFRAAARVGHSDLGVNRRRMVQICKQYNQEIG